MPDLEPSEKYSDWDEKHLIAFLYLAVADSDFVITEVESALLQKNLHYLLTQKYGLGNDNCQQLIQEVSSVFKNQSDASRMQIMDSLSDRIILDWDTYQLVVKDLDSIAHSDSYISIEEHSVMYFIRLKFRKNYPEGNERQILS